ncbi:MAG: 4Fe-4S dicluster domain-containing protein [Thermodesulfobacteriota bacterium]
MNSFILQKDKLQDFLDSLHECQIWAPVKRGTATTFELTKDLKDISLDLKKQVVVSKSAIFPQTEPLFTFDRNGTPKETDLAEPRDTIVLGIRPCDARSFNLLDPVFKGDFSDPYYLKRRNNTVLIGIACNDPFLNCFCTSIGGNPFSQEGLDLLFTEFDGAFYIEVITEKGKQLIDITPSLYTPATAEDTKQKEGLANASEGRVKRQIDSNGLPEKLSGIFEHPIWKQFASKCIGCGICTYSCPTCYCFDMQDETTAKKGRRVRIWDSCMFSEYTLHASGHNPRQNRNDRLRNRIYHKFKFNIDNHGVASCVGCGRCITLCPVNVDLIENLTAIRKINL